MNTFLWIVQILLAVAFLAAGFIAVVRSKEQLKATGMGWVDDDGDRALKRIGAAEILGACGLVLPALLDIAPILVPLAATGLAIVMIGAMVTHVRRKEIQSVVVNVVLLVLALFVTWGRSGRYAF